MTGAHPERTGSAHTTRTAIPTRRGMSSRYRRFRRWVKKGGNLRAMGETPSPDDLTGRVLGARYRIERPLKRGGMGQVYAAVDEKNDGKPVAVKVVRQALLEDPQAVARFKREAKLVTGMVHDNIVTSLASGDDAGLLWI